MRRAACPGFPRRVWRPVALLIIAAAACRVDSGADAEAVKSRIAAEVEAMNRRDLNALSKIWSQGQDIVLFDVSPPGRFEGWPGIARSFNDFFEKTSDVHMVGSKVEGRSEGSLAHATYDWTMSGKVGATPLDDHGQATAIYRREKDGWRLVHAHYSATWLPAARPPP